MLIKHVITSSVDLGERINHAETKLASIETSHLPGLRKLVRKNQDEISKRPMARDLISEEDIRNIVSPVLDKIAGDLEQKANMAEQQLASQQIEGVLHEIDSLKNLLETKAEVVVSVASCM